MERREDVGEGEEDEDIERKGKRDRASERETEHARERQGERARERQGTCAAEPLDAATLIITSTLHHSSRLEICAANDLYLNSSCRNGPKSATQYRPEAY